VNNTLNSTDFQNSRLNIFLKKFEKPIVIILLAVFLLLNLYLAVTDSQTIDEGPHIAGGYSYLKTGDFRINPEHPPLLKELSALPLLFYNPLLPLNHESWSNYNEWDFARQFLYHNNKPADTIIFLARLAPILIGILLGFYIYKWAKEIFGFKSGLFALFLYSFSPNFIAHAHLVTTDVILTFFFVLSIYYFGKYLKNPNKKTLLIAAFIFSFAFNNKYSSVIFIPILIFIYFLHWLFKRKLGFKKFLITFIVFTIITATVTFFLYGFEIKKPLSDPRVIRLYQERQEIIDKNQIDIQPLFVRPLITLANPDTKFGNFIYRFAENFPVPAYTYWRGLFSVISHNYWGHGSYLLGMTGTQGWWYYFIVAFLVKTPISTILLTLLGFLYFLYKLSKKSNKEQKSLWRVIKNIKFDYWLIIFPSLIYFFFSLTSHINLGIRHIFPIYPFIFIGASSLINIKLKNKNKKILLKSGFIIIVIYYLFTNLSIFPYYLSYFNEAIGGAKNGHKFLLDSNLDWSQDIKRLKNWLIKNKIENPHLLLFGSLEINYYIKNSLPLPNNETIEKRGIEPGYYIISAGPLFDPNGEYNWLQNYKAIHKIGYSIYIFHIK